MAGKKLLSVLCAVLAAAAAAGVLWIVLCCREAVPRLHTLPPEAEELAVQLMDAVCSGDFETADTFLEEGQTLGADSLSGDAVSELLWQAYLESLDYAFAGPWQPTRRGLNRDVKLISLELETVTQQLGRRARALLLQAMEQAEDVSQLYDERNGFRQELVQEMLYRAAVQALEEDVRYTYQVVPLTLEYGDAGWYARADSAFLTALSGGISSRGPVLERFERYVADVVNQALEGLYAVEKVYWLHDSDPVAPRPDPEGYGTSRNPQDLETVIAAAQPLLKGRALLFTTDAELTPDSAVTWYRDDTILSITWQHSDGKAVYTCSEVVIAHPSQFRRFLSDGEFGSGKRCKATEMAAQVNAVTASNGDFYGFRGYGNLVYDGEVKMAQNRYLDTCYVDENGDLLLLDMNTIYQTEDVREYVEEHNIRFSLAFGPILVQEGKVVAKHHYALGETDRPYSRAALCQVGPLHYLLAVVNRKGRTVTEFASHLQAMGVEKAYALDGGQTSTIVMDNTLMNPVDYGGQRDTSDILYFATAIPEGG